MYASLPNWKICDELGSLLLHAHTDLFCYDAKQVQKVSGGL